MDNINYDELILPFQLKSYLKQTRVLYNNLNLDVLKGIEETYIIYNSLYDFDQSSFTMCVINILKSSSSANNFNYNLDKKLTRELSITSKNSYNDSFDSISSLDTLFRKVFNDFIEIVELAENEKQENLNPNLKNLYKQTGMIELVNQIVEDETYKNILKAGLTIIEELENND